MLNDFGQINRVSALPQIYHAVNYLANFYVRFLPNACCELCGCPLQMMEEEESKGKKKKGKNKDVEDEVEMTPEQGYCGHWFHRNCFVAYIN